jgi:hypothetical protein
MIPARAFELCAVCDRGDAAGGNFTRAHRTAPGSLWRILSPVLAVVASLGCALAAAALAQDAGPSLERSLKAAFLYKFLAYVEWPADAFPARDAPVLIGIAGSPGMAAELSQLVAGRSAQGRPISVRPIGEGERPAGIHVLFVAGSESARLAQVSRLAAGPVLVVSETEDALSRGSVINFVLAGSNVRFEVSLENAQKRGLRLSSRLLSVALHVQGTP